jgi:hypothetical protein
MSDFSLMDAIECGIVKLPRVPVADNIPAATCRCSATSGSTSARRCRRRAGARRASSTRSEAPDSSCRRRSRRSTATTRRPSSCGAEGHRACRRCFIVVCNNTSTSKLVYDYISGFQRQNDDGTTTSLENGRLELCSATTTSERQPAAAPNTLLIDSEQLESGEALDDNFRNGRPPTRSSSSAREIVERTGRQQRGRDITDQDLLREVMNTVGKKAASASQIRCVVSVSMLTEGWDANTVTHVLGVRAFGTQLLCEQVIGRALRRQSYDLNEEACSTSSTPTCSASPSTSPPSRCRAAAEAARDGQVRPSRPSATPGDPLPARRGLPRRAARRAAQAEFNDDSTLELTPDWSARRSPSNQGIIGESVDLTSHTGDMRPSTLLFHLTQHLLYTSGATRRGAEAAPLRPAQAHHPPVARRHLVCKGGTYPAQLMYQELADMACERIRPASPAHARRTRPIKACSIPTTPPAPPATSTSPPRRRRAGRPPPPLPRQLGRLRQRLGGRVLPRRRGHPRVRAYVKNQNLGLEVPYLDGLGSEARRYLPDFIVQVDDGRGDGRPAAPRRRDQGLPRRGRQGEEGDHGDLLGAGREQPRHLRPLGVCHLDRAGALRTPPFDTAACDGATLHDLSRKRIDWFLEVAGRERGLPLGPNTTTRALLTHLNLLAGDRPTNAAVLLFGSDPQRFHRPAETKCVHCHGTEYRRPFASQQNYGGDLFEQADQAGDFVLAKINRAVGTRSESMQAPVTYELPPDAVAEAIINALAHRDYSSNASAEVRLFSDRLEVWNPGSLPGTLTLEDLRGDHASVPNNPLLAQPLYLTRYIEKIGSGTQKMIELCREAGLAEPTFEQRSGFFVLTLWRDWLVGSALARLGLSERQVTGLALLRSSGRLTSAQYQQSGNVSRQTASRDLEDLVKKGVLEARGKGRGAFYVRASGMPQK